jgi:hypothetical protein
MDIDENILTEMEEVREIVDKFSKSIIYSLE